MEFLKKSWKAILSVLSAIVGLVFLIEFFTKGLKAKLNNAETEKESAVMNTKVEAIKNELNKESKVNQDLRDSLNPKDTNLSPKEREDYWNKK